MQYFGFDRPSFALRTLGFGDNFDPLTLFKDGTKGLWLDPSELTTLFQDAAGTVPVTAIGDPVGKMLDKSGNGNHVSQSVSTARPTYKGLAYDGVDDHLKSSYVFPIADFTISVAFDTTGVSGESVIISNNNGTSVSAIFLFANSLPSGGTGGLYFGNSLTLSVGDIKNSGVRVLTVIRNGDTLRIYLDGVLRDSKTSPNIVMADSAFHIGEWAEDRRFNGQSIGGLVVIERVLTASERLVIESEVLKGYSL